MFELSTLKYHMITSHTSDVPTPRPATSSRASSFKSSSGKIEPLRRGSFCATANIPITDASVDHTLKGELFITAVLRILIKLRLTDYKLSDSSKVKVKNIASALTNSVYLVKLGATKVLLRIYGPNVLHLIDREYETSVLARLAFHKIGPRLLGQFKNGRIEQWLESTELTAADIRIPEESRYIARRLREFHDYVTLLPSEIGKTSASANLDSWTPTLPGNLRTPALETFLKHVALYRAHVAGKEGDVVFCHNDVQYGNLLRINGEEHHSLAVIDFEYAGPNPRAFDIANHFVEWMADYHEAPSHELDPHYYPKRKEVDNFLQEYIRFGKLINRREDPVVSLEEIDELRSQVELWRPMSHAQWAVWGLIQALPVPVLSHKSPGGMQSPFLQAKRMKSQMELLSLGESAITSELQEWVDEDAFDYAGYSAQRISLFYGDIVAMKLISEDEVPPEYEFRITRCD